MRALLPLAAALLLLVSAPAASAQTIALGVRRNVERLPAQFGASLGWPVGPGSVRLGGSYGAQSSVGSSACIHLASFECSDTRARTSIGSLVAAYVWTIPVRTSHAAPSSLPSRVSLVIGPAAGVRQYANRWRQEGASSIPESSDAWQTNESATLAHLGVLAGAQVRLAGPIHLFGEMEMGAERELARSPQLPAWRRAPDRTYGELAYTFGVAVRR